MDTSLLVIPRLPYGRRQYRIGSYGFYRTMDTIPLCNCLLNFKYTCNIELLKKFHLDHIINLELVYLFKYKILFNEEILKKAFENRILSISTIEQFKNSIDHELWEIFIDLHIISPSTIIQCMMHIPESIQLKKRKELNFIKLLVLLHSDLKEKVVVRFYHPLLVQKYVEEHDTIDGYVEYIGLE